MPTISASLLQAYQQTTYTAWHQQQRLDIRIGQGCPALDALLQQNQKHEWAFVTACNPYSKELSPAENHSRHQALLAYIRPWGNLILEGQGIPDDPQWTPETSILILGISKPQAIQLAQHFNQNAIVAGQLAGQAELVSCL